MLKYRKVEEGLTFFYNTLSDEQYKYSLEIPFNYQINEVEFDRNEDVLYQLSKDLRNIFKDNEQELWYSFTMSLESSGKFKLHYDYINWFNTEYSFSDQMMIWKNKYLGEVPNDENNQALIDQYYREFQDSPI